MDVLEAIKGRRSIRAFRPDPVPEEDVARILDAARYAPSAGNGQPWRFLVVTDRDSLAKLRACSIASLERCIDASSGLADEEKPQVKDHYRSYAAGVFAAPLFVFVFVVTDQHEDLAGFAGALAVQNILLAAWALGYGSCVQTTLFREDLVSKHFDVPADHQLVCVVPIGKVSVLPQEDSGRRPLDELVWRERFSGGDCNGR
jgi:nitroreductase